jgi:hypothetical protein
MSDPNPDRVQQARNAIQRVVEAARQGQARLNAYRQEKVALGAWLREHLFRQGGKGQQTRAGFSLRNALTVRCLRQRQEVHRNGGGHSSSAAAHALQRAVQAKDRRKHR